MITPINIDHFKNQWVAYGLTNERNETVFVGISKLTDVMRLPGLPSNISTGLHTFFMSTAVDDVMKAANEGLRFCENRPDLIDGLKRIIFEIQKPAKRNGRPIECLETGERFTSVTSAAAKHGLTLSALSYHLRGLNGHKTVKGKTYRYMQ